MTDLEMLDATIRTALGLSGDADLRELAYGRTDEWDSVGHMQLVVAIEDAFKIELSPDEVFAMSDYTAVREVVRERVGSRGSAWSR